MGLDNADQHMFDEKYSYSYEMYPHLEDKKCLKLNLNLSSSCGSVVEHSTLVASSKGRVAGSIPGDATWTKRRVNCGEENSLEGNGHVGPRLIPSLSNHQSLWDIILSRCISYVLVPSGAQKVLWFQRR